MDPVVAQVQYQLQPVVVLQGDNWAVFEAAFMNYARQQGFATMLEDEGAVEPNENLQRWRQRMAQATTAITSGWVSQSILDVFRYSATDNAHSLWRRLRQHYGNITDVRQLSLRDCVERFKQRDDEPNMDFWVVLTSACRSLKLLGI